MKRSKKKEDAFIKILSYLRWYSFIVGLVFISNTSDSDATSKNNIHQLDKQKPLSFNVSFDKNWKTLGLKNKTKTVFTPNNDTLRLESEQSVAFYYYRLQELSRNPHCQWRISFSWRVLEANKSPNKKQKKEMIDHWLCIYGSMIHHSSVGSKARSQNGYPSLLPAIC